MPDLSPAETLREAPHCRFHIRVQVTSDPTYRYEHVHMTTPDGSGTLITPHPPAVGDLIGLYDQIKKTGGTYRVIERCWGHSSFGSMNWPWTERLSTVGPSLDLIVVAAEGLFVNEAEQDDDAE